jgi:hypothetical protein
VHTLAAAAHEVLLAVARKRNPSGALNSVLNPENPRIVPSRRKEYADIIHGPQNFFKHGSRDVESAFDFRPETTPFNIFDCLILLEVIEGVKPRDFEFTIFEVWFYRKHADLLKKGPFKELLEAAPLLDPNDRHSHYQAIKLWHIRNRTPASREAWTRDLIS